MVVNMQKQSTAMDHGCTSDRFVCILFILQLCVRLKKLRFYWPDRLAYDGTLPQKFL